MKERYSVFHSRPIIFTIGVVIIILCFTGFSLLALENINSRSPSSPSGPTDCYSLTITIEEATAFLPVIPERPGFPSQQPQLFASRLPGTIQPNPDNYKDLYGYLGPYYNPAAINGKVVILDSSLYQWPGPTWKASGLVRNQTRCPIHLKSLTARLRGPKGELLDTVNAVLPVDGLRPGEPGPFTIQAPISPTNIRSIDWSIDFEPTYLVARPFIFRIFYERYENNQAYSLYGEIKNSSTSKAATRMAAAWLDEQNRVIFVASPKIAWVAEKPETPAYRDEIDLVGGEFEDFMYQTTDTDIAPRLGTAKLLLWGIAK